jgi:hypothetical protein
MVQRVAGFPGVLQVVVSAIRQDGIRLIKLAFSSSS